MAAASSRVSRCSGMPGQELGGPEVHQEAATLPPVRCAPASDQLQGLGEPAATASPGRDTTASAASPARRA